MKLSPLDEALMHQAPLPMEMAATSDHRFFDRYMNSMFAPDGSAGVMVGIGVYKNMNVTDGFAVVQRNAATQHNLRVSRALRPDMSSRVGPLRIEIVEPLKSLRYVLEPGPDYPHSFDLTFDALVAPHLEAPHTGRIDGRLATDYLRYAQVGHANGVVRIGDDEIQARDWFLWRDHSWGVRPNVGGFDPFTGTTGQGTFPSAIRSGGKGLMLFGFGFATSDYGGYVQLIENGLGDRIYLTGYVIWPDGRELSVVDAEYDIDFHNGTRDFNRFDIRFKTSDGQSWDARNVSIGRTWIFKGSGYDGGYNDGRGQGVYRSEAAIHEYDAYDVTEMGRALMPDGSVSVSSHREQHCRMTLNGDEGFSYIPIIILGDNHRFKFD